MSLANPNWFTRRKYGGWGVGIKTWQGGVYITVLLIPFVVFQMFDFWSNKTRLIVTGFWIIFLLIEVIGIQRGLKLDEREKMHEAIADRNAMWGVLTVLIVAIIFQICQSIIIQELMLDWWIVTALFVATIIKSVTNYKLEKKN